MDFTPTPQQVAFRDHARVQCRAGLRLVPQWVVEFDDEDVTVRTVNGWLADEAFVAWWREAFPEHAGLTSLDARMIDYLAHECLSKALAGGDVAALGVWQRMRAAEAAAKANNVLDDEEDLAAYVNAGSGAAWRQGGPVGEAR